MTTRIDLRAALDMLPRFDGVSNPKWSPEGKRLMTNLRVMPRNVERYIHRVLNLTDRHHFEPHIEWVDVKKENVHVIHRSLRVPALMWLYRHRYEYNRWRKDKLPIYIRFKGKLIVWNGTHRMTLGRLTGKKVRARVFDLGYFAKWKKTHPIGWDAKVVTVKPKRRAKKKR